MSVITDMVLSLGGSDKRVAKILGALNAWCDAHASGQRFERIPTDAAGGNKVFTADLFACSGNFFPWEELEGVLREGSWARRIIDELLLRARSR